eukprot:TRINITY_DN48016_c0_g1_i1.p1 TRINITY_DN48016_c0_g1~~TRINITY_DN48016_c0_g1_i1.p1  ORF type:complete len:200 (-),score=25.45 TRINITY_DN48016_c0_g1_i1:6-605(-)
MAASQATKFSFLSSHGGPGCRKEHHYQGTHEMVPARSASLPQMNIPAGFSASLGNRLGLSAYTNLRGPHNARRDVPIYPPNPKAQNKTIHQPKVDELWLTPERIRPESLPPAGQMRARISAKKMVSENTNNLSHVDTLIWNCDSDRSDILRQGNSSLYSGAAGLNQKAERTPVYGHLPPVTMRTFGPDGPQPWDLGPGE